MIATKKYVCIELVVMLLLLWMICFDNALAAGYKPSVPIAHHNKKTDTSFSLLPEGEWLVKDKTATIRMVACDGLFWGAISWEKTPGLDEFNPDKTKQTLPMQGLPILRALRPGTDDGWHGEIYNADNGKLYRGTIRVVSENTLKITGCLLEGYLCGSERWQRVTASFPSKIAAMQNQSLCQTIENRMH